MLKIEKLSEEIQNKILELKSKGYSNQEIADEINLNFSPPEPLTYSDIFLYFNKRTDKALQALKASGEFEKKMAERLFDTIEQINNLNAEMWDFFYKLKNNPEQTEKILKCPSCGETLKIKTKSYTEMIKTAEHLLKQIQHTDLLLGKIQKKSLSISYNIVDINNKIAETFPKVIDRLEKEGRTDSILRIIKKKNFR